MSTETDRALGVQTSADLIERIKADANREVQAPQLPAIQYQLASTKGRTTKVLPPAQGRTIPNQGRRR